MSILNIFLPIENKKVYKDMVDYTTGNLMRGTCKKSPIISPTITQHTQSLALYGATYIFQLQN